MNNNKITKIFEKFSENHKLRKIRISLLETHAYKDEFAGAVIINLTRISPAGVFVFRVFLTDLSVHCLPISAADSC